MSIPLLPAEQAFGQKSYRICGSVELGASPTFAEIQHVTVRNITYAYFLSNTIKLVFRAKNKQKKVLKIY